MRSGSWSLRQRVLAGTLGLTVATLLVLVLAAVAFSQQRRADEHVHLSHDLQLSGQQLLRGVAEMLLTQGAKSTRDETLSALLALDRTLPLLAAHDDTIGAQRKAWHDIRVDAQGLLVQRVVDSSDEGSLVRYGRLIHRMQQFLPVVAVANERAQARADSARTLAAGLMAALVVLTLLSVAAGRALLRLLDRQLGGDPRLANEVSLRIAEGELDTPVPHSHPHSVLAALEHVRVRLLERRSIEQRVHYLARHDTLSGALNRAHFNELLGLSIEQARRDDSALGVLFIDLDRFKEVNDTLGHAHGDEVIRICARRLRGLLRQGDQLARLGGDEFAVLAHGLRDAQDLEGLAGRVIAAMAGPMKLAGQDVRLGASVGVALLEADVADREDLLHRADLAMYRAKAAGRGGYSVYDQQLDEQLRDRRELVRDLRHAVDGEQLFLNYQPIVGSDGRTRVGYEALLRWRHPQRGLVPPDRFIPLAEDAGIIDALGRWVMRRACMDAARWPPHLQLSVNLSVAQLESADLATSISAALELAGLPARRLLVEITESMLITHREQTTRALQALSRLGVGIAVDDFGTGYSSLAYLWRFDFDKLKIDRSFIADLQPGSRVHTVVRAIISLAHSLGMKVTAEGVERPEQLRLLQDEGCDEMQGYLLGRPDEAPQHAAPQRQVAPDEASVA